MNRIAIALCAACMAALPITASAGAAQNIAVGGRAGTLGIGPDVSVALGDMFAVRGGIGLLGFSVDLTGRFGLSDRRTAKLTLPKASYTVGAEFKLGGMRVGAGLLFESRAPTYEVTLDPGASIDIGAGKYEESQIKTLITTRSASAAAPYVVLGFGTFSASGLSFGVDVGAARLVDPSLSMRATGLKAVLDSREFQDNLRLEEKEAVDEAGAFLKYWPIVSVAVRYGIG